VLLFYGGLCFLGLGQFWGVLLHHAAPLTTTPSLLDRNGNGGVEQPTMVFMAGLPGAGKTHVLERLFGQSNIYLLDIDVFMPHHPRYNHTDPAAVYDDPAAYGWANDQVPTRIWTPPLLPP
jgi:hypothetical protein